MGILSVGLHAAVALKHVKGRPPTSRVAKQSPQHSSGLQWGGTLLVASNFLVPFPRHAHELPCSSARPRDHFTVDDALCQTITISKNPRPSQRIVNVCVFEMRANQTLRQLFHYLRPRSRTS